MKTPYIIKETPEYIKILYHDGANGGYRSIGRESKFLCLGGPFDGKRMAAFQLGSFTPKIATTIGMKAKAYGGYMPFNCASGSKRRNKHDKVSSIWVWGDLFEDKNKQNTKT